ncbi:MAG: hypothetical protein A2749_00430 [Parcubacteria group bacterium RIFCSPHIGHO2_01_FULL_45_26]|nr:MAG: hypothetical protein A2749_00430 [Parcubacteria group bacterium RIFCSPHIGHO2_01_FULL_45_26]
MYFIGDILTQSRPDHEAMVPAQGSGRLAWGIERRRLITQACDAEPGSRKFASDWRVNYL